VRELESTSSFGRGARGKNSCKKGNDSKETFHPMKTVCAGCSRNTMSMHSTVKCQVKAVVNTYVKRSTAQSPGTSQVSEQGCQDVPVDVLPGAGSHRSNKASPGELYLGSAVVQSEQKFPAALLSALVSSCSS